MCVTSIKGQVVGKAFFISVWHVFDIWYFLLFAFSMASRFLMGVMTISFALPIDLYNSLWNSKAVKFSKIVY